MGSTSNIFRGGKIIYYFASILIISGHIYLSQCRSCSTFFVWWDHFSSVPVAILPVVFVASLSFHLITRFTNLHQKNVVIWIEIFIYFYIITNIVYWLYFYSILGNLMTQYFVYSGVYIFLGVSMALLRALKTK